MSHTIDDIFGPDGLLSRAHDNYEYRPQQVDMARAVDESLSKRRPLIVEAATGTGKTLAYLAPALLSQKRVVISTGTKALQGQLFDKDLPFLQRHWPRPFEVVQLKGRRNYLCLQRFDEMTRQPRFRNPEDAKYWPTIVQWAEETDTGDRAEIDELPDDYRAWTDMSVGSDGCLGQSCPFYDDCFVFEARERAQQADIIVVNHHLFFADLSVRDSGFGEILPDYDAVIFDEAHHLEHVATSYFGVQVSNWRIKRLVGDIGRSLDAEAIDDADVDAAGRDLSTAGGDFFDCIDDSLREGRYPLAEVLEGRRGEGINGAHLALKEALDELHEAVSSLSELGENGQRLAERCIEIKLDAAMILATAQTDYAFMVEKRDRGVFLQAAPINLADVVRSKLLDTHDTLVFTSATLATAGSLTFFKRRLGMTGDDQPAYDVDELILAGTFDYEDQCALYIPKKLPDPHSDDFVDNVALIVSYLTDVTEGRAFVLFTSYANMNAVHERVAPESTYPILKQGDAPKNALLDRFRRQTHSVLFATSSFWEGVDVEGEALSLVIIDKLPFANPSDPLMRARLDDIDARGGNSFRDLSMPQAALTLKQGFGRLIRSQTDSGIVAILDSRLAHKGYGPYFLDSLPPAPLAWTAPAVKRWWLNRRDDVD